MAGNKYLKTGSTGFPTEEASVQTSAGAGDAGKIVALNSSGLIDDTMLSIQAASQSMTAGESLSAGDFVCFLARFRAGDSYANCDGSTSAPTLGAADFVCFLNAFRAGCP